MPMAPPSVTKKPPATKMTNYFALSQRPKGLINAIQAQLTEPRPKVKQPLKPSTKHSSSESLIISDSVCGRSSSPSDLRGHSPSPSKPPITTAKGKAKASRPIGGAGNSAARAGPSKTESNLKKRPRSPSIEIVSTSSSIPGRSPPSPYDPDSDDSDIVFLGYGHRPPYQTPTKPKDVIVISSTPRPSRQSLRDASNLQQRRKNTSVASKPGKSLSVKREKISPLPAATSSQTIILDRSVSPALKALSKRRKIRHVDLDTVPTSQDDDEDMETPEVSSPAPIPPPRPRSKFAVRSACGSTQKAQTAFRAGEKKPNMFDSPPKSTAVQPLTPAKTSPDTSTMITLPNLIKRAHSPTPRNLSEAEVSMTLFVAPPSPNSPCTPAVSVPELAMTLDETPLDLPTSSPLTSLPPPTPPPLAVARPRSPSPAAVLSSSSSTAADSFTAPTQAIDTDQLIKEMRKAALERAVSTPDPEPVTAPFDWDPADDDESDDDLLLRDPSELIGSKKSNSASISTLPKPVMLPAPGRATSPVTEDSDVYSEYAPGERRSARLRSASSGPSRLQPVARASSPARARPKGKSTGVSLDQLLQERKRRQNAMMKKRGVDLLNIDMAALMEDVEPEPLSQDSLGSAIGALDDSQALRGILKGDRREEEERRAEKDREEGLRSKFVRFWAYSSEPPAPIKCEAIPLTPLKLESSSGPLAMTLERAANKNDIETLETLLDSGIFMQLDSFSMRKQLTPWLFEVATSHGAESVANAAYGALTGLLSTGGSADRNFLHLATIARTLAALGAKTGVLASLGSGIDFPATDPPVFDRIEREKRVWRLVELIRAFAKSNRIVPTDTPPLTTLMLLISLDHSTSPALKRSLLETIMALINKPFASVADEIPICQAILRVASSLSLSQRLSMLNSFPRAGVPCSRMARWIAYGLLTDGTLTHVTKDEYLQPPPLIRVLTMLLDTSERALFDVIPPETDFEALLERIDILSVVLTDVQSYVDREAPATPKGEDEEPDMELLEMIGNRLQSLHGKIHDTRAAYLDRTRVKDAMQRLRMRILYQRKSALQSRPKIKLNGEQQSRPQAK